MKSIKLNKELRMVNIAMGSERCRSTNGIKNAFAGERIHFDTFINLLPFACVCVGWEQVKAMCPDVNLAVYCMEHDIDLYVTNTVQRDNVKAKYDELMMIQEQPVQKKVIVASPTSLPKPLPEQLLLELNISRYDMEQIKNYIVEEVKLQFTTLLEMEA